MFNIIKKLSLLSVMSFVVCSCTKEGATLQNKSSVRTSSAVTVPAVTVYTIAGKLNDHGNAEDGNGANARFWNPGKMVYDNRNKILYVADGTTIRSIDAANNVKTYMPLGTIGNYSDILDIALAPGTIGGALYFTTKENDLVKIEPSGKGIKITKIIDRIYGGNETGGLNTKDHLDGTYGVAAGKNGAIFFFNAYWNTMHRITLYSPTTGTVDTFAGKPTSTRSGNAWPFKDAKGQTATFGGSVPDIAVDTVGNIYVADFRNDLVRKVTPGGKVTSLFQYENGWGVDVDGAVSVAQANRVTQVSPNGNGSSIFFTTYGLGGYNLPALRVVRPGKDVVTLVGYTGTYGDGAGNVAGLGTIGGIAATPNGKVIYIAEPGNKVIRKVVYN